MGSSFRIGRVAGIEVGIHWTWLLVFWLVLWTLADGVFPTRNPGLSDGTYWAMAAVASVLFFTSVLLHEFGHALQARRDGVEIDGITLWLFGGVAQLRGMYDTAGAAFRIAAAGPLVSAAIAALLLAVAAVVPLPDAVDGVVTWLGWMNLILLVFNLLPALPLDGGRLLHAALWRARGDLRWATRVSGAVGRAIGAGLIGLGFLIAFAGALLSGLWLAVIGWFITSAAGAEVRQQAAREALRKLHVRELMSSEPVVVPPEMTVGEFMDQIARVTRYTTYPVVEDGRPIGVLSFRSVAELPRSEWDTRSVRDTMTAGVPTLRPGEEATAALERLGESPVRRALVVDEERLVGVVSEVDVLRAIEVEGREPR